MPTVGGRPDGSVIIDTEIRQGGLLKGFSKIKEQWLEFAHNHHQPINVKTEKELKSGIFSAIDDNGYLILKTNDKEEKIIAGDLFI